MNGPISHMTFIVKDLPKSAHMWKKLFGAKEVYQSGENTFSLSKEMFLVVDGLWVALMEGNSLKERTYNHIAFQITDSEVETCLVKLQELGLEVEKGRSRVEGEGKSIYFYDYDNHLLELHTGTLEERLERYKQG